jgi:hypothetical protein
MALLRSDCPLCCELHSVAQCGEHSLLRYIDRVRRSQVSDSPILTQHCRLILTRSMPYKLPRINANQGNFEWLLQKIPQSLSIVGDTESNLYSGVFDQTPEGTSSATAVINGILEPLGTAWPLFSATWQTASAVLNRSSDPGLYPLSDAQFDLLNASYYQTTIFTTTEGFDANATCQAYTPKWNASVDSTGQYTVYDFTFDCGASRRGYPTGFNNVTDVFGCGDGTQDVYYYGVNPFAHSILWAYRCSVSTWSSLIQISVRPASNSATFSSRLSGTTTPVLLNTIGLAADAALETFGGVGWSNLGRNLRALALLGDVHNNARFFEYTMEMVAKTTLVTASTQLIEAANLNTRLTNYTTYNMDVSGIPVYTYILILPLSHERSTG